MAVVAMLPISAVVTRFFLGRWSTRGSALLAGVFCTLAVFAPFMGRMWVWATSKVEWEIYIRQGSMPPPQLAAGDLLWAAFLVLLVVFGLSLIPAAVAGFLQEREEDKVAALNTTIGASLFTALVMIGCFALLPGSMRLLMLPSMMSNAVFGSLLCE